MRFIFTGPCRPYRRPWAGEMAFLNEVEQGLKDTRTISRAEPRKNAEYFGMPPHGSMKRDYAYKGLTRCGEMRK